MFFYLFLLFFILPTHTYSYYHSLSIPLYQPLSLSIPLYHPLSLSFFLSLPLFSLYFFFPIFLSFTLTPYLYQFHPFLLSFSRSFYSILRLIFYTFPSLHILIGIKNTILVFYIIFICYRFFQSLHSQFISYMQNFVNFLVQIQPIYPLWVAYPLPSLSRSFSPSFTLYYSFFIPLCIFSIPPSTLFLSLSLLT